MLYGTVGQPFRIQDTKLGMVGVEEGLRGDFSFLLSIE